MKWEHKKIKRRIKGGIQEEQMYNIGLLKSILSMSIYVLPFQSKRCIKKKDMKEAKMKQSK